MAQRNYFIPSLIILTLLLVLCIVAFMRERKLSIFLLLIPPLIIVLLYSPISTENPKIETIFLILAFITGSITYTLSLKKK
jgi:4-hydroxybenzoate polyprenyltransferase